MNERDARLLPRLIESLDTLADESEIVNTVRRIRQILGTAAFSSRMGPLASSKASSKLSRDMVLSDDYVWRLRGLALRLRLNTHTEPEIAQAKERVCTWLSGLGEASGRDLMLMLLFLGDLLQTEQMRPRKGYHAPPGAMLPERVQQDILATMAALLRGMGS